MNDQPYLRYVPKQKRSIERFNHILDTADALFAEQGYENISTNHIAERAEVAIGSIYHFFPGKEAVLHALIDRYMQEMHAVFPQDVTPPRTVEVILTEMLHNLAHFKTQRHNFDQIMLYQPTADHTLHQQAVGWVDGMLAVQFPQLAAARRHVCAEVGFAIVKGMLGLVYPPAQLAPQVMQAEVIRVMTGYLTQFLADEGIDGTAQIWGIKKP